MSYWRIKECLLFAFLALTVLYYFLRFQWGWDQNIVALQALLLVTLSGISALRMISGRGASLHPLFFYFFIVYAVALLMPTYIRGGVTGTVYAVKDYVLPAMLLIGYSYFIPPNRLHSIFYSISILGLVVSLIYFAEFISKNILFTGYFNYTDGIRKLSAATGADYLAESSFSDGANSFFRLVGPLSHNNSTATIIAVGCIATAPLLLTRFRLLAAIILTFCVMVLLLTGSRTAVIAVIIGFGFYYRENRAIITGALAILVLIFTAISFVVPAFIEVISLQGLTNASKAILSEATNLGSDRIYNILIGSGYNYPGFDNAYVAFNGPVLNDDLFIIQLITTYGLLPVSLFFLCVVGMRSVPKCSPYGALFNSANAILICLLVTVAHTNALIRPQIYPLFFLMIVAKYVIHKRHIEETSKHLDSSKLLVKE